MRRFPVVGACFLLLTGTLLAQQQPKGTSGAMEPKSMMVAPSDVTWSPAPPGLPAGAQVTVLEGDPGQPGPFTLQIQFPDGYKVMPHWHPTDERQTVVKGTIMMGMGEKWNEDEMKALPAGGFVMLPAKHSHYVVAKGEAIMQVQAEGPFDITYINATDDPRKKK
jgi:quercetin dioxygenase-like cupin family protein